MRVPTSIVLAALTVAATACTAQSSATPDASENLEKAVTIEPHQNVEPSEWCGDKELTVGMAEGNNNSWRQAVRAVVEKEVAKCSVLESNVRWVSANGDQQKAISDINGLVAQGVDVLLVNPDFGAAELPALRAATKAGVTVIVWSQDPGGTPGTDYSAKVVQDLGSVGQDMADWLGQTVVKGNVVFLGGVPGAAVSANLIAAVKRGLSDYPDIKLLVDEPVTTDWNKVGTQRAVSGLLARYPNIDGIMTDWGLTAQAAMEAFANAGAPVPATATLASTNELGCAWKDLKEGGNNVPLFTIDYSVDNVIPALHMGVQLANGEDVPRVAKFHMLPYADTPHGKLPDCDRSLPLDVDLSAPLTREELAAAVN